MEAHTHLRDVLAHRPVQVGPYLEIARILGISLLSEEGDEISIEQAEQTHFLVLERPRIRVRDEDGAEADVESGVDVRAR